MNNKTKPIFDWNYFTKRKQDLPHTISPNGAIYISTVEHINKNNSFYGSSFVAYEMPPERSIDIDDINDFQYVEFLISNKKMNLKINDVEIGTDKPCFIIAEAGVNHNGDLELAKKLIDVASEAGADAVKFQTFKSENVCTIAAEKAEYQKKNDGGQESQLNMLKRLELSYGSFRILKKYCDNQGIVFLSTPHTEDAVDFLEDLVPAYKVGSGDLTNIPVLKKIAKKGKPIILGTGMATMYEVQDALKTIHSEGNYDVIMLHCTTNYPCLRNEVNLRAMQTMQNNLDCLVGYSDHTEGIDVSLMAVKLGAVLIEKHFTLDKKMQGPDHKASLDPTELKDLIDSIKNKKSENIKIDKTVLGSKEKKPNKSEIDIAKMARKSIIALKNISKGNIIKDNELIIKRPGIGIKPKELIKIIGKRTKKNILKDDLLNWNDLE